MRFLGVIRGQTVNGILQEYNKSLGSPEASNVKHLGESGENVWKMEREKKRAGERRREERGSC